MNHPRNKPLLSDVLAEEADVSFREALLARTLHIVKRRRQLRKARQAAYACLVVTALAFISFHFLFSKPLGTKPLERPYLLVETQPTPARTVVSTRRDNSLAFISSSATVELVTTSRSPSVLHQIDDDELLALLPSPALLVRLGPHLAELVFADPDARETLLRN